MSRTIISISVDQSLKNKFDLLCEAFGLSAAAAFNIFMKTVVREKRIPFEIRADNTDITRTKALDALSAMQHSVAASGMGGDITLEEINAEIQAVRNSTLTLFI